MIIKSIRAFFLLLAGLVVIAHMIIPHDHHLADPFSRQEKNCPASNNKSGNNSRLPLHCHAFNDLASEKLRTFNGLQNIQLIFISFKNFSDSSAFELQVSCVSIIDLPNPIFDSYTLESSQLRAPPA
jgi:hypothetical protein